MVGDDIAPHLNAHHDAQVDKLLACTKRSCENDTGGSQGRSRLRANITDSTKEHVKTKALTGPMRSSGY